MKFNIVDDFYDSILSLPDAVTKVFDKHYETALKAKTNPEFLHSVLIQIFNEVANAVREHQSSYDAHQIQFDLKSIEIANSKEKLIELANQLRRDAIAKKLNLTVLREMNSIVRGPFAKIISFYRNESQGVKKGFK